MANALTRVGILALAGCMAWLFYEPHYLWLLCLLYLTKPTKETRLSTMQEFDALHDRIDDLQKQSVKHDLSEETKDILKALNKAE
jgi:hypothetical protein